MLIIAESCPSSTLSTVWSRLWLSALQRAVREGEAALPSKVIDEFADSFWSRAHDQSNFEARYRTLVAELGVLERRAADGMMRPRQASFVAVDACQRHLVSLGEPAVHAHRGALVAVMHDRGSSQLAPWFGFALDSSLVGPMPFQKDPAAVGLSPDWALEMRWTERELAHIARACQIEGSLETDLTEYLRYTRGTPRDVVALYNAVLVNPLPRFSIASALKVGRLLMVEQIAAVASYIVARGWAREGRLRELERAPAMTPAVRVRGSGLVLEAAEPRAASDFAWARDLSDVASRLERALAIVNLDPTDVPGVNSVMGSWSGGDLYSTLWRARLLTVEQAGNQSHYYSWTRDAWQRLDNSMLPQVRVHPAVEAAILESAEGPIGWDTVDHNGQRVVLRGEPGGSGR